MYLTRRCPCGATVIVVLLRVGEHRWGLAYYTAAGEPIDPWCACGAAPRLFGSLL